VTAKVLWCSRTTFAAAEKGKQMDLNEFRNKMSSDATEENKRLKAELTRLKKQ
jgi:hypothetical protein